MSSPLACNPHAMYAQERGRYDVLRDKLAAAEVKLNPANYVRRRGPRPFPGTGFGGDQRSHCTKPFRLAEKAFSRYNGAWQVV